MNRERYAIGVIRYGNTLLLRRYDDQKSIDMNDVGHVFDQMCTANYQPGSTYKQLIEGNIGNFRTLITADIDAVSQENGSTIELKCRRDHNEQYFDDIWLQVYLSKLNNLIKIYGDKSENCFFSHIQWYSINVMVMPIE